MNNYQTTDRLKETSKAACSPHPQPVSVPAVPGPQSSKSVFKVGYNPFQCNTCSLCPRENVEAISGAALAKSFRWRSKAAWSEYSGHFTTCSVLLMESGSTGRAQRNMTRIGPSMFDMSGGCNKSMFTCKGLHAQQQSACHSLPLDDCVARNAHLSITCTRTKVVHKTESTKYFPRREPERPSVGRRPQAVLDLKPVIAPHDQECP